MTEIESLKAELKVTMQSLNSAIELGDYESAHILSEKVQLKTKQILLCQKQAIQEQN